MTLNGLCFYLIADLLERRGTELQAQAARLLFVIAPFALLQPLGYLVRTAEYSLRWDWLYLIAALATAIISQRRQRRAFYYAGLMNTGAALFLIASHRDWFDKPAWAVTVIALGLVKPHRLMSGYGQGALLATASGLYLALHSWAGLGSLWWLLIGLAFGLRTPGNSSESSQISRLQTKTS